MDKELYLLASKWISEAKHSVVFTGAGISVESGIPPFRGENGLWSKYNPIFLETSYFLTNPKKSWELIKEIFYDFFGQAIPNDAHYILAEMEKKGYIKSIITQNIDNLHQKAGNRNVIEFHGTSRTLTCINCHHNYNSSEFIKQSPPHCPECHGLLKPDFVFFGEPIPLDIYEKSVEETSLADLYILIGTTGEIMPASAIPFIAKNRAKFIEINISESNYTNTIADIFLKGKASIVLKRINNLLNKN